MERQETLKQIRQIIGGKKFEFSADYINRIHPKIGTSDRPYSIVTKKYVYVYCYLSYKWVDEGDEEELRAVLSKIPVCYSGSGKVVGRVPLDDLTNNDLEKLLREIKYFLWWESEVHYLQVKADYEQVLKYKEKFDKWIKKY